MDDRDAPPTLEERLRRLDWSQALTRAALIERLGGGEPFADLLRHHLPERSYVAPQDVLNALPRQAREDGLALRWGDAGSPGAKAAAAAVAADVTERRGGSSAVGIEVHPAAGVSPSAGADPRRQPGGWSADGATAAGASATDRIEARAGAAAQGAIDSGLPGRVRETAARTRDQVLGIRTRPTDAPDAGASEGTTRRSIVASVAATLDRMDHAVARRPGRATSLGSLGLTLFLVAGLEPWLARRDRGSEEATGGPGRLRPWLLLAGAVAVAVNLADVWRGARGAAIPGPAGDAAWGGLDGARPASSAGAASDATDEYPTVGSA